jgi:hypothetical protein
MGNTKVSGLGIWDFVNATDEDKSERRDSERRNKWRVEEVAIVKIFMFVVFQRWIVALI